MNDNSYFSPEQSGFLHLHSTVTCLLKNTDDWYNGLDLGKLVGVVFIDLKKAFDTVAHDILCRKLEYYGIQQQQLAWFKSYLFNRKQFSRVNGVDSPVEGIDVGVPQGSCLGPLLFLIYINDLPQAVRKSNVSMYADDTSLCHQSSDITQLNEAINSDLAQLERWLKGNKHSLNVMKTHSMLISTKPKHKALENQGESLKLKIRDNELEVVQKSKYLGVQIDYTLDWKEHIRTVSSKVSRGVGFVVEELSAARSELLCSVGLTLSVSSEFSDMLICSKAVFIPFSLFLAVFLAVSQFSSTITTVTTVITRQSKT